MLNQTDSWIVVQTANWTVKKGWGDTEYKGESSDVLLEVELPIVAQESCQDQYSVSTKNLNS